MAARGSPGPTTAASAPCDFRESPAPSRWRASCSPAIPTAAQARQLGLQDDRLFLGPPITTDGAAGWTIERGLSEAQHLGVRTLKLNVRWSKVVGTDEAAPLKTGGCDTAVDAARRRGLHVHLTLTGPAPPWATGNHREGSHTPDPLRSTMLGRGLRLIARDQCVHEVVWYQLVSPRANVAAPLGHGAAGDPVRLAGRGCDAARGGTARRGNPEGDRGRDGDGGGIG